MRGINGTIGTVLSWGDSEVQVLTSLLLTDGVSLGKRSHLSETRFPHVKGEPMFLTPLSFSEDMGGQEGPRGPFTNSTPEMAGILTHDLCQSFPSLTAIGITPRSSKMTCAWVPPQKW